MRGRGRDGRGIAERELEKWEWRRSIGVYDLHVGIDGEAEGSGCQPGGSAEHSTEARWRRYEGKVEGYLRGVVV